MKAILERKLVPSPERQICFADVKVRLIAFLIDNIIFCFVVGTVLWLVYFRDMQASAHFVTPDYISNIKAGTWFLWERPLLVAALVTFHWLYYALAECSLRQATPGKFFLNIKVTCTHGQRISFWRASLRYLTKLVSLAPAMLGLWTSYYSYRKQMLHDKLSNCQLVVL